MPSLSAELLKQQLQQSLNPLLWPRFDSVERCDDDKNQVMVITAFVPDNLGYFAGHFPEQPVLPGVVQVHWAGELSKILFEAHGFSELKSVKFSSMVLPNQNIELILKFAPEKGTVRFSYQSVQANDNDDVLKFSSGMLSFSSDSSEAS